MDHIRAIQEIIDIHREELPTGVVSDVMAECQKAYVTQPPRLYKILLVNMDSHPHVERCEDDDAFACVRLSHRMQTIIVEAVDELTSTNTIEMLESHGMVLKRWINLKMPLVLYRPDMSSSVIIHSIVPYEHGRV